MAVSHFHEDHGWIAAAPGAPTVVDRSMRVRGIQFRMTTTAHDADEGCRMGLSRSIAFQLDGIRILHTGDIGDFDDAWIRARGKVDLLLLPVGGVFTLPPARALAMLHALKPAWCVPMHYASESVRLEIAPREPFLQSLPPSFPIHRLARTFRCDASQAHGVIAVDPAPALVG